MVPLSGLTFLNDQILLYDDLVYRFYGDKVSYEILEKAIDMRNQWNWVIYLVLPILYLSKFFLVTCAVMAGIFFAENIAMDFSKVFKIVIISEFIFIIPPFIKLIWFGLFYEDYTFFEMQYFYPLSIGSMVDIEDVPQWIIPFTLSLNLFEIAYWMLLGFGMSLVAERTFSWGFRLVLLSYVAAWFLYQVLIIFLTIIML